jgi:hypothetical protein
MIFHIPIMGSVDRVNFKIHQTNVYIIFVTRALMLSNLFS